jgi:iron(III) transport system ATP-binding protein
MVFQDYALFPHLTVEKNIAYGLPRGGDRDERVEHALEMVGLAGLGDRMPYELSGGQQQRVALARALAPEPEIVLLDEPFSNLDPELRVQVRGEVREILRSAGATAILVTHDQEEALSLADRIAVMFQGRIVQTAAPEEVYHRPASRDVAAFVGDAQFIAGQATGHRVQTALAELPIVTPAEGQVDVLIRPEMVRLRPESEGTDGPLGIVRQREFFGHDQVLTIELTDGTSIKSRLGSYGGFRLGDRVRVSVRGAVLAFPVQSQPDGNGGMPR